MHSHNLPTRRHPFLAALLSFACLGLGHLYNGKPHEARIHYWRGVLGAFGSFALADIVAYFAPNSLMTLLMCVVPRFALLVYAIYVARLAYSDALAIGTTYALQPSNTIWRYTRFYVTGVFCLLLSGALYRTFVAQAFKIPAGSMLPTLAIGDHFLAAKFAYGLRLPYPFEKMVVQWGQPARGDVVVFVYPRDRSKDFIERVVAVAGDEVEIRHKQVYINDTQVDDPHATFAEDGYEIPGPRDNFGPVTVPPHHLFVMGDNRDRSHDGRFWGFVNLDDVKGRAFLVYWSQEWNRIGTSLKE